MRERLCAEIPKTERLKSWLDANGIELVLFDLDDTLIVTHQLFKDQVQEFFTHVFKKLPFLDQEKFLEKFDELEMKKFYSHAVNPVGYQFIIEELKIAYGSKPAEVFQEGLPILLKIYKIAPPFYPGAKETLQFFKAINTPLGLVTHGNLSWTNIKIRELKLRDYFKHIWIADEDGYKNQKDWHMAISWLFGAKPENTLVMGDNVSGDIQAAIAAGVKPSHAVLIPSRWSVYRRGKKPEGTLEIEEIGKLIDTLLAQP